MTPIDIVVVLVGLALSVGLAWLFFKPQQAAHARVEGGAQMVDVK